MDFSINRYRDCVPRDERGIKENEPRMWDDRKYELVIQGRPTRARRVSLLVGCPIAKELLIQIQSRQSLMKQNSESSEYHKDDP